MAVPLYVQLRKFRSNYLLENLLRTVINLKIVHDRTNNCIRANKNI